MGYKINETIDQFYTNNTNIEFYGTKPILSGFPLVPVITYNKGFSTKDVKVTFSKITISGFPIPTQPLTITIKDGLGIIPTQTSKSLDLDYLKAILIIPKSLPASARKKDIRVWQEAVNHIKIQNIETAKAGMDIFAKGQVGLNENLQPILDLNSIMTGHEDMVQFLVETGELKPLPAALALSALNAMVKTDPQTNESFVDLKVRIQDRVLFLGPIRTVKLPPIYWP